jgi:antitoxin (DNA-binding transcriptional repressor) of toxin-antitoxin stability system
MKTITLRELRRQRWSKIEATLRREEEITITRDSKPVAKLVRIGEPVRKRKRWDPEEHRRWLKKVWGGKMLPSSDAALARARADRWEKKSSH